MNGLLPVWKPKGMSSFGVVARVRRLANIKKVGHGGTLDPMAEGVLVLALGGATRVLEYMLSSAKVYEAEATLGASSTTYDSEGVLTQVANAVPTEEEMRKVLEGFLGTTMQRPPAYSAIHVDGERAYAKARRGEEVVLPARPVHVEEISLLSYTYPVLRFRVHVSGGTYIRSIIHDMGSVLGTGAYMSGLTRTAAGGFATQDTYTLDILEEKGVAALLLPIYTKYVDLPVLDITPEQAQDLKQGKKITCGDGMQGMYQLGVGSFCMGIGEVVQGVVSPKKMFPNDGLI